MLADKYLPHLGYKKRIHLMNPMVPGLEVILFDFLMINIEKKNIKTKLFLKDKHKKKDKKVQKKIGYSP